MRGREGGREEGRERRRERGCDRGRRESRGSDYLVALLEFDEFLSGICAIKMIKCEVILSLRRNRNMNITLRS